MAKFDQAELKAVERDVKALLKTQVKEKTVLIKELTKNLKTLQKAVDKANAILENEGAIARKAKRLLKGEEL